MFQKQNKPFRFTGLTLFFVFLPSKGYANTHIYADNSPFVVPNNAASNQQLGVVDQLNDGIRMFETETHYNATTSTVSCCRESCFLGPFSLFRNAFGAADMS